MVPLPALTLLLLLARPDAVVLENSVTVELDSVYTETTRLVVVPLNGRGVSRYSVMTVPFRAGWERIEVVEARTGLWRSGRRGSDALITQRPHSALGAQSRLESSMRELVMAMPGLETGDTVVVHTRRVVERLPLADCYSYLYSPGSRDSLAAGEFTVIDRTGTGILREWSPDMGPPEVSGDITVWRIGPLPPLDTHPLASDSKPYACVATSSPEQVSRELYAALDQYGPPPGDLPDGLSGETDPETLRRWVADHVEYMGADIGDWPGFTPKSPEQTLRERAGVCRDSAVLLAALIRRAGGTAWLAMLNTSGGTGGLVGSRSFDHMVVAVPWENGYHILDPSVKGVRGHSYGLRGAAFLPLTPRGSSLQRVPLEGWNDSITFTLEGSLDDGALRGTMTVSASGAPGELVNTLVERVPLEHLNLMMARFLGASEVTSAEFLNDTLRVAGSWSTPSDDRAVLLPGLRDVALPGTRAAYLLLPRMPAHPRLDSPAAERLVLRVALNGSAARVPGDVSGAGYTCRWRLLGDTLEMTESAFIAPILPDPETIGETLLLRSGSAQRTVLLP
jgi:hypothetical protein